LRIALAQTSANLRSALSSDPTIAAIEVEPGGLVARFDYTGDVMAQAMLLKSLIDSGLPVAELQEEPRSMQAVYSEKMRGVRR
jgi:hypothetical protein